MRELLRQSFTETLPTDEANAYGFRRLTEAGVIEPASGATVYRLRSNESADLLLQKRQEVQPIEKHVRLLIGPPVPLEDPLADYRRWRTAQSIWRGGTVLQSGRPVGVIPERKWSMTMAEQ